MTARLALICMLFSFGELAAQVGPDHFEFAAQRNHAYVNDIALLDETLLLLQPNALAGVDLGSPGSTLQPHQLLRLDNAYDRLYSRDRKVWLWTYGGLISLRGEFGGVSTLLFETHLEDSLLGVAATEDLLIAAHGFGGLGVYRQTESAFVSRQLIERGAHYVDVIVTSSTILALDDYNGFELYALSGDSLLFKQAVLSEIPLRHVAMTEDRIAVSDGLSRLIIWELSASGIAGGGESIELGYRVAALGSHKGSIIIAGSGGEIANMQPGTRDPQLVLTSGLSKLRLLVSESSNGIEVVTIDPLFNVSVAPLDELPRSRPRTLMLSEAPSVVQVAGGKILASNSSGIFEYGELSGELVPHALWEGGVPLLDLKAADSVLVALRYRDDQLMVLAERAGKYRPVSSVCLADPPQELKIITSSATDITVAVTCLQTASVFRYDFATRQLSELWTIDIPFQIAAGDFSSDAFVAISTRGEFYCRSFALDTGALGVPWQASVEPLVQDALLDGNNLLLAHASGLSIYQLDTDAFFLDFILSPIAVESASALALDPETSVLLVGGESGIKFTDFGRPANPGIFYSIPDTKNVRHLSIEDGALAVSSRSSVKLFRQFPLVTPDPLGVNAAIVAHQFFPNPFNEAAAIDLSISPESIGKPISYEIVNILGQDIWSETRAVAAASERFVWDGRDRNGNPVSSGIYFFRAALDQMQVVRKLVYLK